MRKSALLTLLFLGCAQQALAGAIPGNTLMVPTIAALRAKPYGTGLTSPNIGTVGYYAGSTNCGSVYSWNAADTRADDGGGVINPAPGGTPNVLAGRWNLQLQIGTPAHSCQWGVLIDTPVTQTGPFVTTDNSVQLQRLIDWAFTYGPNSVYFDSLKGFTIGYLTSLVPHEGEVFSGNGQQQNTGLNPAGSNLWFFGTSGAAIALQTPFPGVGNTQYESPKFYNFGILIDRGNGFPGSTGCIQLNSNAGGFTNDNTSQQPILHPVFENVSCIMGFGVQTQVGIYCGKCFDGRATNVDVEFGEDSIIWDGSDDMEIAGSTRLVQPYSYHVKFLGEGGSAQFGNMDRISGGQLLSFSTSGQAVDAFIFDSAQTSEIENLFIEGSAPSGGTLTAQINIGGGINHKIENNYISGGSNSGGTTAPWIEFSGCPINLTAINNAVGANVAAPIYTTTGGGCPYWFNNSQQSQFVHYGNTQKGDVNWPFNSVTGSSSFSKDILAIFSTSTPGLIYTGLGITEQPSNGQWVLGPTGSTNDLLFENGYSGSSPIKGVVNAQLINAFQSNNTTGQITCQITDNGTKIGSTMAVNITGNPYTYDLAFGATATTNAGLDCWNTGTAGTGIQGAHFSAALLYL